MNEFDWICLFQAVLKNNPMKGVLAMDKEKKIKLSSEDVKEFVTTAEQCDFDIDVFYNRVIIDAKSILGVLSLDLTKVLTVKYAGKDNRFEQMLQKYCVA